LLIITDQNQRVKIKLWAEKVFLNDDLAIKVNQNDYIVLTECAAVTSLTY